MAHLVKMPGVFELFNRHKSSLSVLQRFRCDRGCRLVASSVSGTYSLESADPRRLFEHGGMLSSNGTHGFK